MLAATTQSQIRRNHGAEPPRTDQLVGQTCKVLDRFGVAIGPSKVARLVHTYEHRVASTGYPFAAWIANGVALHAGQRRQVVTELGRVIAYADPTGETAAANVDRRNARGAS